MFVAGREDIGPAAIYLPLLPVFPHGKPHVAEKLSSGMWGVLCSPAGAAQSPVYIGTHQLGFIGGREASCCPSVWSQSLAAAGCSVHIWVDGWVTQQIAGYTSQR